MLVEASDDPEADGTEKLRLIFLFSRFGLCLGKTIWFEDLNLFERFLLLVVLYGILNVFEARASKE